MKPREIQVFDGLRLTTEHMNHLQGAFQSAVQDMRQIAGLGRVHHGFELVKEDDGQITVLPGTAFDREGNRIVSDERRDVPVEFGDGETTKFVCVAYQELEDGLVEGRPTLIWDSCVVSLRANPPGQDENLVPLGVLMRQPDAPSFIIQSLDEVAAQSERPGTSAEEETILAPNDAADQEQRQEPEQEPQQGQEQDEVIEASAEMEEQEGTGGEEAVELAEGVSAAPASAIVDAVATHEPFVRQGLIRLGSAAETGAALNDLLLEPLRQKLDGVVNGDELRIPVTEGPLAVDFSPLSFTFQTILRARLTINGAEDGRTEATAAMPLTRDLQAMVQGEASRNGQGIAQVGLAAIEDDLRSYRASGSRALYATTELGIAHLPLGAGEDQTENEGAGELWGFLDGLQLLLVLQEPEPPQGSIAVKLLWVGGVDEKTVEMFETRQVRLAWTSVIAWKALGNLSI